MAKDGDTIVILPGRYIPAVGNTGVSGSDYYASLVTISLDGKKIKITRLQSGGSGNRTSHGV